MLKAFKNKGTKLLAAMVAMVMMISVAKVPVKAATYIDSFYYTEGSTPCE